MFFSLFLQVFRFNIIRKSPQNGEKVARFPGREKMRDPVTSLAVTIFWVPISKNSGKWVPKA